MNSWQTEYAGIDREAIWAALLASLKASLGASIVTAGRHLVQAPSLAAEQQPAMFVVQAQEMRSGSKRGLVNTLILNGFIILYFQAPQPQLEAVGSETLLGSTTLNVLLKAIDDAMVPDNMTTGKFTIGGLVTHCWIEGQVDMDPGIYTQQGAAILPVKILVP